MAKGTRRELRRAFGPEVLQTVDNQGATIENIAATLYQTRRDVVALAADYAILKSQAESLKKRDLFARLRWLFTGK